MSLVFGANTTDRVSHGTLDGLDWGKVSCLIWYYRTAVAEQMLMSRIASSAGFGFNITSNNSLHVSWSSGSSSLSFAMPDGSDPINTWLFAAVTVDVTIGSGRCHLYQGSLTAPVAELSPTGSDGSGTMHALGTRAFVVGNTSDANVPFQGSIAVASVVGDRILTLAEIQQFFFRPGKYWNEQQVIGRFGAGGVVNVPDWSGHANTGTITGANLGADLPLPSWFGYDQVRGLYTSGVPRLDWLPVHVIVGGPRGQHRMRPY